MVFSQGKGLQWGCCVTSYRKMLQSLRMNQGIASGPEDEAIVPVPCPIQLDREGKIKTIVWKIAFHLRGHSSCYKFVVNV